MLKRDFEYWGRDSECCGAISSVEGSLELCDRHPRRMRVEYPHGLELRDRVTCDFECWSAISSVGVRFRVLKRDFER